MHVGIVACNHVNTVTKSFLLTDNTIGKCSTLLSCFSEARELNVELSILVRYIVLLFIIALRTIPIFFCAYLTMIISVSCFTDL